MVRLPHLGRHRRQGESARGRCRYCYSSWRHLVRHFPSPSALLRDPNVSRLLYGTDLPILYHSQIYCAIWVGRNATVLSDFVRDLPPSHSTSSHLTLPSRSRQQTKIAGWCWAYVGAELLSDTIATGSLVYYLYIVPRKQKQGLAVASSGCVVSPLFPLPELF
jgi:hypothetical protein